MAPLSETKAGFHEMTIMLTDRQQKIYAENLVKVAHTGFYSERGKLGLVFLGLGFGVLVMILIIYFFLRK